VYFVAFLILYH